MPLHTWHLGSLKAKQLHHLQDQPSLGQSCHRHKVLRLCTQGPFGHVQLFVTLWTVVCQPSLSGEFSRQEYWSLLANTGCHTLLEHYISCCSSCQIPWCCQNPCDPSSCTASTPGPHKRKLRSSRAASEANPSG